MAIHKVLDKIQQEINELAPTLELFVHDNIHPSVEDCEKLQKQLNDLQEILAVYKYKKHNTEISPSFNIHAKLSAQATKEEKQAEIANEVKAAIKIQEEEKPKVVEAIPEPVKEEVIVEAIKPEPVPAIIKAEPIPEPVKVEAIPEPIKTEAKLPKSPLIIGLNDKFRFLNELFSQNNLEYNIALEQLNNLLNWSDTEIYLNSLKALYGWKDNNDAAKQLFSLAKQRFH